MSYMKEHLMDTQDKLISQAAQQGKLDKFLIWDIVDTTCELSDDDLLEVTQDICDIAKKGIKGIYAEYEERTGNVIKENKILDLYEDIEFDSQNDMLCDIIYSIRELRREQ